MGVDDGAMVGVVVFVGLAVGVDAGIVVDVKDGWVVRVGLCCGAGAQDESEDRNNVERQMACRLLDFIC